MPISGHIRSRCAFIENFEFATNKAFHVCIRMSMLFRLSSCLEISQVAFLVEMLPNRKRKQLCIHVLPVNRHENPALRHSRCQLLKEHMKHCALQSESMRSAAVTQAIVPVESCRILE